MCCAARMMLRGEDDEVAERATELISAKHRVLRNCEQVVVGEAGGVAVVSGVSEGRRFTCPADALLVAAGRTPNGDELGAAGVGIACDGPRVLSDDTLATNVEGVWALGDSDQHAAAQAFGECRGEGGVRKHCDVGARGSDAGSVAHAGSTARLCPMRSSATPKWRA